MSPWLGLPMLLVLALILFILWGAMAIAWDATHPPRKGFAWALATQRPCSPESLHWKSQQTTLPGLDGVPCPAWRIEGGGTESAPMLLMVHGWGRSRWDSLARLPMLLACVREAWLPDLPAHGEHVGRRSWVGVREPQAIEAMLQRMHERDPTRKIVVMGHSLGAGVALRGAARAAAHGLPIAGVIMLSPYRDLRSPIPARLALRALPVHPFAPLALFFLRAIGCMDAPLEHDASTIDLPTLIVACQEDCISPAIDATVIADAMPHATLLLLPGDRHDHPGAADVGRFTAYLQAFLNGFSQTS